VECTPAAELKAKIVNMPEQTSSALGPHVSVLIPVFNEEKTIRVVVEKVLALGSLVKEVVIVDDGSTDGTAKVAEEIILQSPLVHFFHLEKNQGKTAAIRHAMSHASGEVIIIQDADLEYDPAEIPFVVSPILLDLADVVYLDSRRFF
jgi:glycosyltransferase involved in cell wall biosynthesis